MDEVCRLWETLSPNMKFVQKSWSHTSLRLTSHCEANFLFQDILISEPENTSQSYQKSFFDADAVYLIFATCAGEQRGCKVEQTDLIHHLEYKRFPVLGAHDVVV